MPSSILALPCQSLSLIWDYLEDENRQSLLRASKALRVAFGGIISSCTLTISKSESESRGHGLMSRMPAHNLQSLKLNAIKKVKKGPDAQHKKLLGHLDPDFDHSLASFFEVGAYHQGELPWSNIKHLRMQGFELGLRSIPWIGLAAPHITHVHLSHVKLDGMCFTGLLSCSCLFHLTLSHVAWLSARTEQRALAMIPKLPNLRRLTLIEVPLHYITVCPYPFMGLPNIESLELISCPFVSLPSWAALLKAISAASKLTNLVIHPHLKPHESSPLVSSWVKAEALQHLVSGCPKLRCLDLGASSTVTTCGTSLLVNSMPHLQHLAAKDLRPLAHRTRQEAMLLAGGWMAEVQEQERRRLSSRRKEERKEKLRLARVGLQAGTNQGSVGTGSPAGQASPTGNGSSAIQAGNLAAQERSSLVQAEVSQGNAGTAEAGDTANGAQGRAGSGMSAARADPPQAQGNSGTLAGTQASTSAQGLNSSALPRVGGPAQDVGRATHPQGGHGPIAQGATAAATSASAQGPSGTHCAQDVAAAEAAIAAHLYPVHGADTLCVQIPCCVPWRSLTLFSPSMESLAALPLGPHTDLHLGGIVVRPGTPQALASQAATHIARCHSFATVCLTGQGDADTKSSRDGSLQLIYLPSWHCLQALPDGLAVSGEAPSNGMALWLEGSAVVDIAAVLVSANQIAAGGSGMSSGALGSSQGGLGGGGHELAGTADAATAAIASIFQTLGLEIGDLSQPLSMPLVRNVAAISKLLKKLKQAMEDASTMECICSAALACLAAADTEDAIQESIRSTLDLQQGEASLPAPIKLFYSSLASTVARLRHACTPGTQPALGPLLSCKQSPDPANSIRSLVCAEVQMQLHLVRAQLLQLVALDANQQLETASEVLGGLGPLRGRLVSLEASGAHASSESLIALSRALGQQQQQQHASQHGHAPQHQLHQQHLQQQTGQRQQQHATIAAHNCVVEGACCMRMLSLTNCTIEPEAWKTLAHALPHLNHLAVSDVKEATFEGVTSYIEAHGEGLLARAEQAHAKQERLNQLERQKRALCQAQQQQQQQQPQQQQQRPQQGPEQRQQKKKLKEQQAPQQQQQQQQVQEQNQGPQQQQPQLNPEQPHQVQEQNQDPQQQQHHHHHHQLNLEQQPQKKKLKKLEPPQQHTHKHSHEPQQPQQHKEQPQQQQLQPRQQRSQPNQQLDLEQHCKEQHERWMRQQRDNTPPASVSPFTIVVKGVKPDELQRLEQWTHEKASLCKWGPLVKLRVRLTPLSGQENPQPDP